MNAVLTSLDYGERGTVEVVADAEALAHAAASHLISAIDRAVADRGIAAVALSGGSTPKRMGQLLAQPGFREAIPWQKVQIFWGDERWVPLSSPESNAGEAMRAFLDHVPIPSDHIHPYQTESLSAEESAQSYECDIRAMLAARDELPRFDLIFLGMGDDGHTASLFPGTAAIHEHARLVVAHEVAKLQTARLTMTPPLLNAAREIVFLTAGAGKAARLANVLDDPIDVDLLPSQVIRPQSGTLTWLVDRAATAMLARQPGS